MGFAITEDATRVMRTRLKATERVLFMLPPKKGNGCFETNLNSSQIAIRLVGHARKSPGAQAGSSQSLGPFLSAILARVVVYRRISMRRSPQNGPEIPQKGEAWRFLTCCFFPDLWTFFES
jgi:hypothetical protein